jgi:hypothetical protein
MRKLEHVGSARWGVVQWGVGQWVLAGGVLALLTVAAYFYAVRGVALVLDLAAAGVLFCF